MKRAVAECRLCGKTVTTEEIETGASLVCQTCDPNESEQGAGSQQKAKGGREQ